MADYNVKFSLATGCRFTSTPSDHTLTRF